MARIVLASGSPRRQELLTRIGIRDFTVRVPQVEEWYPQGLTPPEIVSYISREKSQAVPSEEDEIVITADTMVFLDQQRLGKPKDEADALRMLTDLAGRRHTVCTGVTLRQGQRSLTRAQSTDVYFRPAGREELTAYIRGGEPMDKAGAYGVQGPAGGAHRRRLFQRDGSAGAAAEPDAGGVRRDAAVTSLSKKAFLINSTIRNTL